MNRPLVICDCDEVLLHMIVPFRDWLSEAHDIDFVMQNDFATALRYRADRQPVEKAEIWRLLNAFFDSEMDRQRPIAGAVEAVAAMQERAELVVLTNLLDHRQAARRNQLEKHGIKARVFTNQGPKGEAIARIAAEYGAGLVFFIDDLPQQHASAAELAPETLRLHFCGEPELSPLIDCAHKAGHAQARIDRWQEALPWLLEQM